MKIYVKFVRSWTVNCMDKWILMNLGCLRLWNLLIKLFVIELGCIGL
jgi:hypothetical protein